MNVYVDEMLPDFVAAIRRIPFFYAEDVVRYIQPPRLDLWRGKFRRDLTRRTPEAVDAFEKYIGRLNSGLADLGAFLVAESEELLRLGTSLPPY